MRISGDLKNTTGFRDPVVSALRTLEPGILRFWGGNGQLGDTLDNLLAPEFGRQRAEFSAWATRSEQISYGLHDFLRLCQVTGAEPWFVVPSTFTTEDASHLIDYLTGAVTVPYGAKRAALGQTAPWTEVFSTIHLEFGNEAWNSGFKGGSIEYAEPYGARAQTIFGVMRANPAYVPAKFDLVLGGQAAWPGRNSEIQKHCTNNDSFAIAPYTMGTVDSFDTPEALFGSTFAEPEAYVSPTGSAEGISPGVVYQNWKAVQSPSRKVPLSFYEINMGTLSGTIPQAILDDYTPSLGAGLTVVDTMLISMSRFGVTNQAFFALPQYRFPRPDHKTALLWGAVVDMGVTDRKRPQFLALQLANQAIGDGSSMLRTKQTGADPVWNQPLANTVKLSAAHYIQSYAFRHGSGRSLIVFNFSLTASLPITFSDVNAPSGTVEVQRLTSAKPSDTNEKENLVQIQAFTLHDYSPSSVLSLPPFSMTVLKWNSDTSNFERSRRQ
jgi:hypothetical protein